jgi:hypothetical protein
MIQIQNLNSSANLKYFKEYLISNYDFKNIVIGFDCLCLEFETEPNQTEETSIVNYYNAITESDWLDSYKGQKLQEINNNTDDLIKVGYTYAGLTFSLSEKAQTNILALYSTKDDPVLPYPLVFNTIDDLNSFEAIDATTIANMYYSALATVKGRIDSGTVFKDQIRNATTVAEVDAIQDTRI